MTKEKLWAVYVQKNPKFAIATEEIILTGKGLKKLFNQTFDQGFKQGKEITTNLKEKISSPLESNNFNDAFKNMFGKFGI